MGSSNHTHHNTGPPLLMPTLTLYTPAMEPVETLRIRNMEMVFNELDQPSMRITTDLSRTVFPENPTSQPTEVLAARVKGYGLDHTGRINHNLSNWNPGNQTDSHTTFSVVPFSEDAAQIITAIFTKPEQHQQSTTQPQSNDHQTDTPVTFGLIDPHTLTGKP